MRHFLTVGQAGARPLQQAETGHVRRFVAALEQPLQPEADSQQRCAVGDRRYGSRPSTVRSSAWVAWK